MLDRSSKLDDSLMDAYRSIHEIHKGHAAGESDIEKQASQLASDIRYKAKGKIKDGMNAEDKKRIFLKLLASSPAPGVVKSKAKRKLLGESVDISEKAYRFINRPAGVSTEPGGKKKAIETGKKVEATGKKVVGKVIRGVAGIAKRKGTLSQKVTGAAIDAVKGRAKKALNWADSKPSSSKSTSSSSKSAPSSSKSTSYRNTGAGRKETASSKSASSSSSSTAVKPKSKSLMVDNLLFLTLY